MNKPNQTLDRRRVMNSLQIRCSNPACEQPSAAADRRTRYDGTQYGYVCDRCISMLHGPHESPFMCRGCGHDHMSCTCDQNKEFWYGGPLVMCDQCRKVVVLVDGGAGHGMAGGMVFYERYSCGHMDMDESGDIAAAM